MVGQVMGQVMGHVVGQVMVGHVMSHVTEENWWCWNWVVTIQHRDTIHCLKANTLARSNEKLKEKIVTLEAEVAHYHENPLCPNGFLANTGQVAATIPISVGYARPAKWIHQ